MKTKAQVLCDKLVEVISQEPEVWKINIFGKLAEKVSDDYSDVDIRIISKDPGVTQQKLHEIVERSISPITETFTLQSDVNCFAQMIMLTKYLPYQKIDISVEREGYGIKFEPMVTIYENKNAHGDDRDCKVVEIKQTTNYNLLNILFGVPRFTKCFFRNDFDMYRRWKDQTNALLVLLNEKYTEWKVENDKKQLSAHEAKLLFLKLNTDDKKNLEGVFPLNGSVNIPSSFYSSLKMYISISKQKADKIGITINRKFADYMLNFAESEINKLK